MIHLKIIFRKLQRHLLIVHHLARIFPHNMNLLHLTVIKLIELLIIIFRILLGVIQFQPLQSQTVV